MPEPKKIVLLGGAEVGKTAVVARLTRGFFPYRYVPTVEDTYRHQVAILGNKPETVEIIDTTGADGPEGENVRNMHAVFADAFIVVFSVKSRASFERARQLLEKIRKMKPNAHSLPVLLVANQADHGESESPDDSSACNDQRQVSTAEGSTLAEHPIVDEFVEVSALANRDVNRIMPLLVTAFRRRQKPKKGLARLTIKARGFFGRSTSEGAAAAPSS